MMITSFGFPMAPRPIPVIQPMHCTDNVASPSIIGIVCLEQVNQSIEIEDVTINKLF
jgi:hypothetical protein